MKEDLKTHGLCNRGEAGGWRHPKRTPCAGRTAVTLSLEEAESEVTELS